MRWLHLLAAFALLTPLAVCMARRDYRRRGRLSAPALGVLLLWFFVPHLTLDLVARYRWTWTPVQLAGAALAAVGLALCVAAIISFRSIPKMLCLDPGALTVSGPYRLSRNPQYVGWFVTLLGLAACGWTRQSLVALGMLAVAIHALVLLEEDHLQRVFGEAYGAYRRRTPRYLGLLEANAPPCSLASSASASRPSEPGARPK